MDYTKMKNAELEQMLKDRSLPHTGKKAEMIARLQDHDKQSNAPATSTTAPETADASSAPAAAALAAGGQERVPNPVAVPNQALAEDPSKTNDLSVAQDTTTSTSTKLPTTDLDGAADEKPAADASIFKSNLPATDLDAELEKRKARAKKFGIAEDTSDAGKALERAKRFGTGTGTEGEKTGAEAVVGLKLDQALPERGQRKRGRGAEAAVQRDDLEDSGLKRRRGGGSGGGGGAGGRGARGGRHGDAREQRNGGGGEKKSSGWMSAADREAAEKRKSRFA